MKRRLFVARKSCELGGVALTSGVKVAVPRHLTGTAQQMVVSGDLTEVGKVWETNLPDGFSLLEDVTTAAARTQPKYIKKPESSVGDA